MLVTRVLCVFFVNWYIWRPCHLWCVIIKCCSFLDDTKKINCSANQAKKNCMETMLFSVSLSFLCLWRVNIQRRNHMIERYEYIIPVQNKLSDFQNRASHTKHTIFNMLFTHKSPNTSCQVFKLIRLLHVVKLFSN